MAPLIVMLAAWLVARLAGTASLWLRADSWTGALRITLSDAKGFVPPRSFERAQRCAKAAVMPLRPRGHLVQNGTQAGTERRQAVSTCTCGSLTTVRATSPSRSSWRSC